LADARAAGLELIDAEPRMGMHGSLIAFVHPKSLGGVLTELVET
jgi:methylmalonyl-CoA/ethylmalonyl-CoA epimerase